MTIALFFYYRKIKLGGLGHIPKNKAILFLSNHQNALMDILLIATKCGRKPWFLTRADVFKKTVFGPLFRFLQMMPIYRMRDGRASLSGNRAIFDECGTLLGRGEAILIFPEANHSLKRRIRPLSKGFTRIIEAALKKDPELDLVLVPVGQNYQTPRQAGDSAALYFGEPIAVQEYCKAEGWGMALKNEVFQKLTKLTTHISDGENYEHTVTKLNDLGMDYTDPVACNQWINTKHATKTAPRKSFGTPLFRFVFRLINLPMILLWRILVKPKVPEPEFDATFRFGFVLLAYPLIYVLSIMVLIFTFNLKTACLCCLSHAVLNLLLVKIGITSSDQRK
ncbi:1-acyl-sn-glycerol-3-phosphate acyltransferase [Muricauda sp. SCSIO 64092]|uniref:1-acyl-sn-glycerol-3-phosphate acyltransferase n=1 Tax=Allomuricauda sp. SCSIO 64092 TaxID=2908842 RepID=UPI001FF1D20C|nr:1-acyl-sn-glycerol-3-phosphate acyltransferase [Muricauda sp. SCSIO 64092]UOY09319.1 1-acyl-sn-glycerol-3-phosphate acyltransferase [Muricauda sp. SCSIO 64092]